MDTIQSPVFTTGMKIGFSREKNLLMVSQGNKIHAFYNNFLCPRQLQAVTVLDVCMTCVDPSSLDCDSCRLPHILNIQNKKCEDLTCDPSCGDPKSCISTSPGSCLTCLPTLFNPTPSTPSICVTLGPKIMFIDFQFTQDTSTVVLNFNQNLVPMQIIQKFEINLDSKP